MLYVKEDKKIFHIHIPRTGGRYIKEVLTNNNYETFHTDYEQSIYGISVMHLHYPLYEMLEDVSNSLHLAIIRDPFERFASAAHCMINEWYLDMENDIYSALETKDGLFQFIEYHSITKRYNSNWLRPQHEFISDKTIIYKYELGLGKSFIDWFNVQFNDNVEHKEYSYYGDPAELKSNKIKENKKIKSHVLEYYNKDYTLFEY